MYKPLTSLCAPSGQIKDCQSCSKSVPPQAQYRDTEDVYTYVFCVTRYTANISNPTCCFSLNWYFETKGTQRANWKRNKSLGPLWSNIYNIYNLMLLSLLPFRLSTLVVKSLKHSAWLKWSKLYNMLFDHIIITSPLSYIPLPPRFLCKRFFILVMTM